MPITVVKLGVVPYHQAYHLQQDLLKLRQQDLINDVLLLLEHPPVITFGKRGPTNNVLTPKEVLASLGVSIYETERGGDVTYHGPGQLVGYPILHLANYGKDIRQFIRNIEDVFIRLLHQEYRIAATRDAQYPGVWVGNDKITAIGFAIKRWVTMHGFAFNINTNLDHFQWIIPCGISDKGVTSLAKLLGYSLPFEHVTDQVIHYFAEVFQTDYSLMDTESFWQTVGRQNK